MATFQLRRHLFAVALEVVGAVVAVRHPCGANARTGAWRTYHRARPRLAFALRPERSKFGDNMEAAGRGPASAAGRGATRSPWRDDGKGPSRNYSSV